METGIRPNKAKTARRVIEILEYFDEQKRHATVMDIARRYRCPQSSTSELLAILVEMGLLYKDPNMRYYMPTPRAAMLGSLFQPSAVRDGRLSMLTDRLAAQTGLGTALMGMVGVNVQIFRWITGSRPLATTVPNGLSGGFQKRLCDSAAGWLLLSTIPPERREGVMRRLKAEAPDDCKFSHSEMLERVQACGRQGYAAGPAGFSATADMCAVLLPSEPDERPMVLGFIYEPSDEIDPDALIALLQKSVQSCVAQPANSVSLRGYEAPAAVSSVS
ncbi:MAG: helix-turn-helix domain-containing protein [Rhizomicrobium sp.]